MLRNLSQCSRNCLIVCFLSICMLNATFFYYSTKTIDIKIYELNSRIIRSDISCYHSDENDSLISIEDPKFQPGHRPIFFHETSCRGGLLSRQVCAVESAARLHPKRQINLLFNAPVSKLMLEKSSLAMLLNFPNVKIARIHIKTYGKNTSVQSILTKSLLESVFWVEHSSDILRILTLNKFGGVYLDTDCIVVQSLDALPQNWIGTEEDGGLAIGAIGFSNTGIGRNVTDAVLSYLKDHFNPKSWNGNGVTALEAALQKLCTNVTENKELCGGVEILPSHYFYPIPYTDYVKYFENGRIFNMKRPYVHHTWNYMSQDMHIKKDSPYAKLAQQYCPSTYKMYSRYWDRELVNGKFRI